MFLLWLFTVCCVILVVVFVTLVYKRCFNGLYEPHIHQLQQLFLFILIFGKYQTCCGLFMAASGGVWIIPSFRIWDYVLYVDHISYVITNCGQHLFWIALEALLEENITRKLLLLYLDLFFRILFFQVSFLIFFYHYLFSLHLHAGLFLQYMALFQPGN